MLFSSAQYWTGTKNSLWNDCTRLGLNCVAKNMQNTSLPRTILYFFFWYVQNLKLRRWAVTCTTSNGEGMVDMYCFNEWFKGRVQVFNFMVFICLSWIFCSILIYMACLHTMQVDWKSIGMFSDAELWNNPFSGIIQCFLKVIHSLSPKLWSADISTIGWIFRECVWYKCQVFFTETLLQRSWEWYEQVWRFLNVDVIFSQYLSSSQWVQHNQKKCIFQRKGK